MGLKNGIERVVTVVADYSPGLETEKAFVNAFKTRGGEIIELSASRCRTRFR